MDAQSLLLAVQQAGFPIIGLTLPDPLDGSTWILQPDLGKDARAQIVLIVLPLLFPPPTPIPISAGPTLDQVIAWQAGKWGIPIDQAQLEVATFPTLYTKTPAVSPPLR